MSQVVGIFDTAPLANQAIVALLSAGLTKDDISLVMSDKTKHNFTAATKNTTDREIVDGAIGAGAGGVFGALLAGLTAAGGLIIPGAQILLVGPVIAMLTGAGAGAVVGGLAGVLSGAGIAEVEATKYVKEIDAGKAVVIAHTKDDQQKLAATAILMNKGAAIKAA